MLCPPMTVQLASTIFDSPPASISSSTFTSPFSGKHTMVSALSGRPPIAYTSLSELVAAIWPKVYGSSTMGVKKSTVWTSASSGVSRYTPASSAVSKPTRTLGSCCRANFPSTESSTAGLSLLAQPAAFTISVKRGLALSGTSSIVATGKQRNLAADLHRSSRITFRHTQNRTTDYANTRSRIRQKSRPRSPRNPWLPSRLPSRTKRPQGAQSRDLHLIPPPPRLSSFCLPKSIREDRCKSVAEFTSLAAGECHFQRNSSAFCRRFDHAISSWCAPSSTTTFSLVGPIPLSRSIFSRSVTSSTVWALAFSSASSAVPIPTYIFSGNCVAFCTSFSSCSSPTISDGLSSNNLPNTPGCATAAYTAASAPYIAPPSPVLCIPVRTRYFFSISGITSSMTKSPYCFPCTSWVSGLPSSLLCGSGYGRYSFARRGVLSMPTTIIG